MKPVDEGQPSVDPRLRIGEAAQQAGVSARTLRYYQEIGLLTPAGTTVGGARRYSEADVARVNRIRHLRDLVGLDLNDVGRVLAAEDRLAAIKREWFEDQSPRRQTALLREAMAINAEMQAIVRNKMVSLTEFLAGLEQTAENYRRKMATLEADTLSRA